MKMMYVLFLMWYGVYGESGGGTDVIEGFKSFEDCNKAYQEIVKQSPKRFKQMGGVCIEVMAK